jgi:hypothetical protein
MCCHSWGGGGLKGKFHDSLPDFFIVFRVLSRSGNDRFVFERKYLRLSVRAGVPV